MRPNWKRIFLILADVALAVYLVLAVTAFDKPDDSKAVCRRVSIDITDASTSSFIDAKEVKRRLDAAHLNPVGKTTGAINTRQIEEMLRHSAFVKSAECYKTSGGDVYISVTQRTPVIRIKADNGGDYYIDDKNTIMPNSHYTSNLVIASGNISRKFATEYIAPLGKAIMANDMWQNLIEQVHVTADHGIEIVPRIGDHIVYLGTLPEEKDAARRESLVTAFVDRKLTRLEKFYRYGLSHAGWNRYSYIDLEFDNQIICTKQGHQRSVPAQPVATTDSISRDTTKTAPETSTPKPQ